MYLRHHRRRPPLGRLERGWKPRGSLRLSPLKHGEQAPTTLRPRCNLTTCWYWRSVTSRAFRPRMEQKRKGKYRHYSARYPIKRQQEDSQKQSCYLYFGQQPKTPRTGDKTRTGDQQKYETE